MSFYAILYFMNEVESPKTTLKKIWEWVVFAFIAIAVVIPIRMFIAQPFVVSGTSMIPTFENADYLIVDELSYHLREPERLEVVIFRYPKDPNKYFIKRIIGLPGEEMIISGNDITIINKENPDGFVLEQGFVKNEGSNDLNIKLKENEYFVMGDNRGASSDSRYWGPVNRNLLIGRAFLRLLPIQEIGIMPGSVK